ncbi:tetratricopeptide repeat protein [Phormidium sp. LEGE 05292]|uniref:tetratricopeptide repeat protein n=1 Tax=[Phormidium] sp. LEGE 05292 TaxID=767427 RepID=UPI00187E0087|nr:tetratricopeptide repeat protein [Phormidium sp. LEGE 05292]MBE9229016.1 tetratricopeptide repeat protein [Phormidium sp. LEGE 05292]
MLALGMARSLKVSPQYIQKVKSKLQRNGYPTQTAFAEDLGLSKWSIQNFFNSKTVKFSNFVDICEKLGLDWQEICEKDTEDDPIVKQNHNYSLIPCTAYKEETWVGREEEIRELSGKLRKECRILIITGITGQGKTALAERLASVELAGEWQRLSAVNFDDGVSRDFVGAADVLLTRLGETVTPQERSQPEFLLNRLVQKLRSNRYLVQIDSVEVLLQKGDENPVRNEFEDARWWEFFKQLLAGGECQSRLILTSQHLPTQFIKKYNKWHRKLLSGLSEPEQLQLFSKLFEEQGKEILPDSEAAGYLLRMGNTYEGHPLLIEVLAGEILEHPYNGNVVAYWRKHQQEFAAIAPAKNSEELERNVKDRVRETLKRLEKDSPYAYGLLLRSSVYRLPVTEDFWLAMLQGLTDEEKNSALGTLKYRHLVEEVVTKSDKYLLRQHNLIRNVAYQRLIEISNKGLEWKDDHYIAAQMWRTSYQPEPDASNLEKVRGYLEAFHHYCEVEDWQSAKEIISTRIDTPTNEALSDQLGTWSYYREQVELYNQLLNVLDESNLEWKAICFNGLGNAYYSQGDYARAINFHQQHLAIATEIGDEVGIGAALGNLGATYNSLGDYALAIDFHQQSLDIARKIGDKASIGMVLGHLGNVYNFQGNYARALDFYQQSLDIATEISDKAGLGRAVCNFGNAYYFQGDYTRAIDFYQQYLTIAIEIGNKAGIGTALGNLGNAYDSQGDYAHALDFYQQHLAIVREIGDKAGIGKALGNFGNAYYFQGDYTRALDFYQQSLDIAREIGDRYVEGMAVGNYGETLIKIEQYSQAKEYLQESLSICREIGARNQETNALNNLAELYQKLGQHDRALEYCEEALAFATELGIPLAQECQKLKEELLAMAKEEQEKRI